MKLMCISSSYFPALKFGGPIFSSHSLNTALVRKGVDVFVFTTNVGLEGNVPVAEVVDLDGVKVKYFPYSKYSEFAGPTGWQFSRQMTAALATELPRFDLVRLHGLWNYPVAAGAYYARKYNKPYIIFPHGLLFPFADRKKSLKKSIYFNLISKRDVQGAAGFQFTTQIEADSARWAGCTEDKSWVIPNGILPSKYGNKGLKDGFINKYPALRGKKVVLFLGRINWIKGLDLLIPAFAEFCRERPEMHLLIVGADDGDGYLKTIQEMVKERRLDTRVTFSGMLTGEDKIAALNAASAFVLPSYSENFGMAAVEAMACGVPIVLSDKVGLSSDVHAYKAGVIVETSVGSLCGGLKTLFDSPGLPEEIAKNAGKMVRDLYDIDSVAELAIERYKGVLNT